MCFEKISESLNKFWNCFKSLTVLKFFESFKENFNKNLEKLNENYNFLLLSILIAGWGLRCSLSFANFPGFQGGGRASPLIDTTVVGDWGVQAQHRRYTCCAMNIHTSSAECMLTTRVEHELNSRWTLMPYWPVNEYMYMSHELNTSWTLTTYWPVNEYMYMSMLT